VPGATRGALPRLPRLIRTPFLLLLVALIPASVALCPPSRAPGSTASSSRSSMGKRPGAKDGAAGAAGKRRAPGGTAAGGAGKLSSPLSPNVLVR